MDDPHDLTVLNRKLYERKCRQVGVVPINLFIRHMENTELSLRGRQCGPNGARALAAPLMVCLSDSPRAGVVRQRKDVLQIQSCA